MHIYVIRRLMVLVPLIFLMSFVLFAILAAAPGDPLDTIFMQSPTLSVEDVQRMRAYYHLDEPVPVRYVAWLKKVLLDFDWGLSRTYGIPVAEILSHRVGNTIQLTAVALVVSLLVSVPIGVTSAVKQYSVLDYVSTFVAFLGRSMPTFWLGLVLIMTFSVRLNLLPVSGMNTPGVTGFVPSLVDRLKHLVLPLIVLSFVQMASWTRYVRMGLLEVMRLDYIRTARAKGLSERVVLLKHALKNTMIPIITLLALDLRELFGGAVVVETVFSWLGVGRTLYDAVLGKDYNLALCTLLLLCTITMFGNLLADIAYALVDPRIRYQ